MYSLISAQDIGITKAANFIAQLNVNKKHHIGYCGTNTDEISNTIHQDFTDIPFEKSFVGAMKSGQLIGLIGFDADLEGQIAELWGPFIDEIYGIEVALKLWDELITLIPSAIKYVSIFSNQVNIRVKDFAERLGFHQKTDQMILVLGKGELESPLNKAVGELSEQDYGAFVALHDNTFPNTYYSGWEIIDRMDEMRRVFILKDSECLTGYVYAEVDPMYGEGSIEFIAVNQGYRGKGYGKSLLDAAVRWIFTFDTIADLRLCVDANSKVAIGLYQSIGFSVKHELYSFVKER